MIRALSTRGPQRRGYEKLDEEFPALPSELSRARSLHATILKCCSRKINDAHRVDQIKKAAGKVHPFFSMFPARKKTKGAATARPEVSRYLEYLKEGGAWDAKRDAPVIYYK